MSVADVQAQSTDPSGAEILDVYAKYVPNYAVYGTKERVLVRFADDPATEKAQRGALSVLNPLRGEINGLIDGWRTSRQAQLRSNARRFERRVADALIVALEDDIPNAMGLLQEVKTDLLEERKSKGRAWYLIVASVTVAAILLVCGLGALVGLALAPAGSEVARPPGWMYGQLLDLSAAAGAVGAFLSVGMSIRNRTVLTDLRFLDNAVDALLRILVGVIAAPVLTCLLLSDLVKIDLGGVALSRDVAVRADGWMVVLVIAFVAGFLERLVPDLLAKADAGAAPTPTSESMPTDRRMTPGAASPTPPSPASPAATEAAPDPDGHDGCTSSAGADPSMTTADADLPPAIGG